MLYLKLRMMVKESKNFNKQNNYGNELHKLMIHLHNNHMYLCTFFQYSFLVFLFNQINQHVYVHTSHMYTVECKH